MLNSAPVSFVFVGHGLMKVGGVVAGKNNEACFPIVRLFPNMVTMLGMCFGLTSMKCAFVGRWESAVVFIIIAAFIDGLDGRVARMLNSVTNFGAQLDSFADFLSFGVAPAFLLYFWLLREIKVVGWIVVMVFVVCISIRLAIFNISLGYEEGESGYWKKYFFIGTPAPVCACLALIPMMITFSDVDTLWLPDGMLTSNTVALYLAFISFLAVGRIPTISGKNYDVPKKWAYTFVVLLSLLMILAITNPWTTFPIMGAIYIVTLPFGGLYYLYLHFMTRKSEVLQDKVVDVHEESDDVDNAQ